MARGEWNVARNGQFGRLAKSAGFRRNPQQHAGTGANRQKKAPTDISGGFSIGGQLRRWLWVSLTAAALRWTAIAPRRAVLVASRDDHMLWAKSNKADLKSGAYFATRRNTIELPGDALAHSNNDWAVSQQQTARAQLWFPREPEIMQLNEMIRVAGQYDYTLTLLLLPEAECQGARHDDEEPEEDTYDRFIRNGQFLVR